MKVSRITARYKTAAASQPEWVLPQTLSATIASVFAARINVQKIDAIHAANRIRRKRMASDTRDSSFVAREPLIIFCVPGYA